MGSDAINLRKRILTMAYECGKSAHIGGALSMAELLVVLYRDVMRYDYSNPQWEDRDRFILSKGHAVLGLYAWFVENGLIDEKEATTYMQNGSLFGSHPVMDISHGIECSSGSLGQGISMAVGIAKAAKLKGKDYRVYTLVGNGECDEGSVWEALMLAGQWKLDNLTVIVDNNQMQSDGNSDRIMNLSHIEESVIAFGFDTEVIDGHNETEIRNALNKESVGKPKFIVAKTVKGKGVSFMENENSWHHNRLIKDDFEKAIAEIIGG